MRALATMLFFSVFATAQEPVLVSTQWIRPGAGQQGPRSNFYTHFEHSFELRGQHDEGLEMAPQQAGRCLFATLRLQGREVTLAIDWGDAEHLPQMHVDRNADRRITEDEAIDVRVLRDGSGTWATEPPVRLRLLGCDYFVVLRREADGRQRGQITGHVDYRIGRFEQGGTQFELFVLDQDHDGRFLSGGDWFTCLPAEVAAAQPRLGPREGPMVRVTDPLLLGERSVRVLPGSDPAQMQVLFAPAGEPLADYLVRRHAASVREWETALLPNAATFHRDKGFAPGDRAAEAIPWRHVATVGEVKEIARAAGRTVCAVFHADWADECREMDVFVFARQDVAAAMADFVPVRYHVPFDLGQEFRIWVAHVLPAYVFVLPDGRVLKFWRKKGGVVVEPPELVAHEKAFKTPAKLIALLAEAKERAAGGQLDPAPAERKQ